MLIYVLHGFGSTGAASNTVQQYKTFFSNDTVVGPTYDTTDPHLGFEQLKEQMDVDLKANPLEEVAIVGTSLGGFWARKMADHYRDRCPRLFLINPSLQPWTNLKSKVGECKNYATGGKMILTEENVEAFRSFYIEEDNSEIPIYVFTAKDDSIVSPEFARNYYKGRAWMLGFAEGGHRMKGHIDTILDVTRRQMERYA